MILLRAIAGLILLCTTALAQTPMPQEGELGSVEQEITSSAAAQEQIKNDVAEAIKEQEDISAKLIDLAKLVQSKQTALAQTEDRILKLRKEEITIRADLAEKQDVLSQLLAGLQRLEQNPPPALVVEPRDVLSALRGAMMFGAIVPELRAEAENLTQKLARLDRIRSDMESEKTSLNQAMLTLKTSQIDLDQLVAQKKQLVFESAGKLLAEKKRATELADKAKSLKQLVAELTAQRLKDEAEKSRQALAIEAERKRQEAALMKPMMVFSASLGRLEYPVQGQILKRFGDDDGLGSTLRGMAVATSTAAQVTAPVDGKVEFAGPFRSYGQLLILNPGEGYLVLLAGMSQISAEIGQTVRAGEPLGTMGDGPSSVTLLGDQVQEARPVLYIEFRNNGEAVDSAPWWIGGMKEARK
jgi:septal ring factor EnvC (AmiA/AmiB activator)